MKNADQQVFTIRTIAQKYGLSTSAMYKAVERGELTHYKFGGRIRVLQDDLDEWLQHHKFEMKGAV